MTPTARWTGRCVLALALAAGTVAGSVITAPAPAQAFRTDPAPVPGPTSPTDPALGPGLPTDPDHDPGLLFSGAFYPTQRVGNRGVNVLTIQYLLAQAGFATAPDGVFDAPDDAAMRAFQVARGLGQDGIVGPQTWQALTVLLRPGAQGDAVRALQTQLNKRSSANVPVNGTFDSATSAAVVSFQQHAGIDADGVVGPMTWTNLAWHFAYPDMSTGICDKDPDGNGTANWGTGAAIGQLEEAVRRFTALGHGDVPLGDVSKEHGTAINGHASHVLGLDVDVWPIRTDGAQCTASRITWQSAAYDRAATRQLINAIRAAAPGHVGLIFFNDPQLIAEGLTTRYDNHDNHVHVRYCERIHPNSLYVC